LPQGISNRGHGLIRGKRVPIRGQVCMDMITVDVSNVSCVEPGDVVTLLGRDEDDEITLRDVAKLGETIEYRVLTGLGRRLARVYIDSNAG